MRAIRPRYTSAFQRNQGGFTLIELIIGMVVFAVALTYISVLIFPQAGKSVDPIMQVRATELANTLLREITSKTFDENSRGNLRCNDDRNDDGDLQDTEFGEIACTASDSLGPEGESRDSFDDVDDFNGLEMGKGVDTGFIQNALGETVEVDGTNLYAGFYVAVTVYYDGNFDGIEDTDQGAKYIGVLVNTPGDQTLQFTAYRSNY